MMRVVRAPDGTVEIDPEGKRPGRGAYLCQQKGCWQKALKGRSLERALRTTLDNTTVEMLATFAQTLPEDTNVLSSVFGGEEIAE
jgi:predicted RNA-binding protein YlxR (DUF448 family)